MLRAVGFEDGDFVKPIIGVANGHSTMNPCNAGIQPLVDNVMMALHEAGSMPQVFGFPTVTDGIGMGTEGMKYSLVSREVIADAIEVAVNGQRMDGVVVVGGCDKNQPAGMMAMARMNVPGIYVYAGTIKPGFWKGEKLTIVSAFEAVGAYAAGKMEREDFDGIEKNACPTVGACGGQYTANTMSSSFEALGMSLLGSSQMASPDKEKLVSAVESARVLVEAVKNDLKPRDIITRKSIENAVALVMATGGSTNAVLHYLAIASAAGVKWTLDDFERVRRKVPVLCNLKPSGKYVATDFHAVGGVPQVLKILLENGALHGECMTIRGKTIGELLKDVPAEPREDQDVIRPWSDPLYKQGHLAILKGNLSPEGCVAKITGLKRVRLRGGLHEGDHGQEDQGRRRDRHPLRGAEGRPGHAGNARPDLRPHRPGPRRLGRASHGRPFLRRDLGHGGRPCRAGSLRRRTDRAGERRRRDHDRREAAADPAQRLRARDRPPPEALDGAEAALHHGGAGEVHAARIDREPWGHHGRPGGVSGYGGGDAAAPRSARSSATKLLIRPDR
jgi:dihydroxy-acid dehydratase